MEPSTPVADDRRREGSPATTVLVCDARPIVRAGLRAALDGVDLVGDCDLDQAADELDRLSPAVLITGLRDDDPATFRTVAAAKTRHEHLRVLVVADAATVVDLREAVIAGVDSFILTSTSVHELRDAVARTARGERIVSPSIAMQLAGSWRNEGHEAGASTLTPRELEVLQLLAEGLTNQQVGSRLGLSGRTVKTHVQNLLVKLDVPDRTGAVARAFRLGLIR